MIIHEVAARRLKLATPRASQRADAARVEDQVALDRERFPIPGLTPATFTRFRAATADNAEVAGASGLAKLRRIVGLKQKLGEAAPLRSTAALTSGGSGTKFDKFKV